MASGSTITAGGMQTMTQVVGGTDLVEPADFNNARTNIDSLFGAAQSISTGGYVADNTYGWSQGGAGVNAASAGELVYADDADGGFKRLQDDVQAACAYLGLSLRAGVGTDVTSSTVIDAATWNNLMLNVQDIWNARFSPASLTATTQDNAQRTTSWTNTLTQITTWTFSTAEDARAFFNLGGALGVSASRTGGHTRDQNTNWTNKLNAIGDVFMSHNNVSSSAGSPSSLGFYDLTTSDQSLLQYFGSPAPYGSDYIQIFARVNSTSAPTEVIITTELNDAGDNVLDDVVDGTLTINARRNLPNENGSGFTVISPSSVSAGSISGS
jgi:hypothetical protein